jgi:hypothetical protein
MPPSLRRYPFAPCDRPESRRPERILQGDERRRRESKALLGDLLIRWRSADSVMTFFRECEAFEKIAEDITPELFKDQDAGETIRMWISAARPKRRIRSPSFC